MQFYKILNYIILELWSLSKLIIELSISKLWLQQILLFLP